MRSGVSFIDKRIRTRFRLFEDVKSEVEDKKIYQKVYELVYGEILRFLDENLDVTRKSFLVQEVNMINKGIKDESRKFEIISEVLTRYLDELPDVSYRLDRRMDHFINNLIVNFNMNSHKPII